MSERYLALNGISRAGVCLAVDAAGQCGHGSLVDLGRLALPLA